MFNIGRKIAAAVGAGALIAASVLPVFAVETAVTATVTVLNISITVSPGSVAYGTLAVNTTQDTRPGGVNATQTATNNGNVTENFFIRGSNSTPGNWVLAATNNVNQYVHEFCITGTGVSPADPCDTSPTFTALTTVNQTLVSGVAVGGTQKVDLKIITPTSSSDFTQQNVNVTVVATI